MSSHTAQINIITRNTLPPKDRHQVFLLDGSVNAEHLNADALLTDAVATGGVRGCISLIATVRQRFWLRTDP